jgi:hypothetical protein
MTEVNGRFESPEINDLAAEILKNFNPEKPEIFINAVSSALMVMINSITYDRENDVYAAIDSLDAAASPEDDDE